jgi:hypothetical protein
MRQHPIETEIFVDLVFFAAGFRFGTANNKGQALQKQNIFGPPTISGRSRSDILYLGTCRAWVWGNDELSFGVKGREIAPLWSKGQSKRALENRLPRKMSVQLLTE